MEHPVSDKSLANHTIIILCFAQSEFLFTSIKLSKVATNGAVTCAAGETFQLMENQLSAIPTVQDFAAPLSVGAATLMLIASAKDASTTNKNYQVMRVKI